MAISAYSKFAREYGFENVISIPNCPQNNCVAEGAGKINKTRMSETADAYKAFLPYWTTPLSNGSSIADLLMGKRLRSSTSTGAAMLVASPPDFDLSQKKLENNRGANNGNCTNVATEFATWQTLQMAGMCGSWISSRKNSTVGRACSKVPHRRKRRRNIALA